VDLDNALVTFFLYFFSEIFFPDLFIMPSLVAEANARLQPAATTVVVTGPVTTIAQPAIMAQPQPVYVQPAQPGMVVMGTTSTGQVIMAPQGQVMQMQPQMMQVNTMTPQVPVNAFTPQNQVMMMGPTAQPQPTTNIYQTF